MRAELAQTGQYLEHASRTGMAALLAVGVIVSMFICVFLFANLFGWNEVERSSFLLEW